MFCSDGDKTRVARRNAPDRTGRTRRIGRHRRDAYQQLAYRPGNI